MQITREEASRIARLAQLRFDDQALDRIAAEMTEILGYIDQLSAVDTSVFASPAGESALQMRDDVMVPSLDRQTIEANAPAFSEGFFEVPRVVGGE